MFYDIIFGRLTTVDREITARCIRLLNCADPEFITHMQYYIDKCDPTRGENYRLAKQFGQQLIDNCREVVGKPPLYRDGMWPGFNDLVPPDCVFSNIPHCSPHRGHRSR